MSSQPLIQYIESAKEKGFTVKEIEEELVKSGWSEKDVKQALSSKKDKLPPPPPPFPHLELWVTFEYTLLFISLYVTAIAIAGVLHYAVDTYINNPTHTDITAVRYAGLWGSEYMLRSAFAGLIIGFPLFAFFFLDIQKRLLKIPALKNLRARKQIIYFTLAITFIIMLIHLFQVLVQILNGEVRMTGVAHMGITLLIAGSIFGYFLYDIREDRKL